METKNPSTTCMSAELMRGKGMLGFDPAALTVKSFDGTAKAEDAPAKPKADVAIEKTETD